MGRSVRLISTRTKKEKEKKEKRKREATHHLRNTQPIHHTPPIIPDIMENSTLPIVKSDSETPLLPFDQTLICDGKTWSIRLAHIQLLQILPQPIGQQLRYIFRALIAVHDALAFRSSVVSESIFLAACSKLVDSHDFFCACVHDWDKRKRVGVEVRVCVLGAGI